jgi:hypothetical protein
MTSDKTTGRCLCGAVTYQVSVGDRPMTHCHCWMCRKASGAAFMTWLQCAPDEFRITGGEEAVHRYRSSPDVERSFCRVCGSTLTFFEDSPETWGDDFIYVAAGTLDGDPGARPRQHIFTQQMAPWFPITDDLPRH